MKVKDFLRVQLAFDFLQFPRMMGSPEQKLCHNPSGFVSFYRRANGHGPVFTSHNSYPEMDSKYVPLVVRISKMFFDFDAEKPENAQLDALKMARYFDEIGMPWAATYSGNKGFHVYLFLKPEFHPFDSELRIKTLAIHRWLGSKLELRTLDGRVAEPRRLCRVPLTLNVPKKLKPGQTPNYCIPVTLNMLQDWTMPEIIEAAQMQFIPDTVRNPGDHLTLDEFIDKFDVKAGSYEEAAYHGPADIVPYSAPRGPYEDYIKALIPDPCIHNEIMTENPRHQARVTACLQLFRSGYTLDEAIDEFDKISEVFKWIDRHNRDNRIYHIRSLYREGARYRYPTCTRIRFEYGLCVGSMCSKFKRYFKDES